MTDKEPLEERVKRLEDIAFDGDGLTRAVTRLGLNANALGEALLTVDRQQQMLTKLGKELKAVDDKVIPREEVEAKVEEGRRARRRQMASLIAAAVGLFCLVFYVSDSAHDACVNRQQATATVRDVISTLNVPGAVEGAEMLNRTLAETCDEQYKLHF